MRQIILTLIAIVSFSGIGYYEGKRVADKWYAPQIKQSHRFFEDVKIYSPKIIVPANEAATGKTMEVRKPSDHDKVALLRAEAAKRGIKWEVWCIYWAKPDQEGFQAEAHRKGEPDDEYHDRWMMDGYTQAEAAYKLYFAIQGPPTHPAESHEEVRREKSYRRICPPALSDTSTNEPCSDCKLVEK